MAENVGYATLDIIPSLRGFSREMERQGKPALTAAGKTGGKQYGDALGKETASTFRTHLKGLGALVAGAAVGRGLFDFFQGSIEGASDLEETASKLQVVFGDVADEVTAFSEDSTKNILLTEEAAQSAAATFGIFGKAAGLTGGDLADFSTKLVGLASDLSSFNNTSTDDAITALGAALRGESEPIRAYGVLLDDATLRQEALRLGIVKTTKQALTPAQRVQAAYSQILKQTADAQGDAARTQDGYANSTKILQKRFKELQTEAGQKLLPALTGVVNFLSDEGIPALEATGGAIADAVGFFRSLPAPVQAATGALVAFRTAQRFGITEDIGRGATATAGALTQVRTRLTEAVGTYREYRSAQIVAVEQGHKFIDSSSRIRSGLAGIQTASRGAGGALKRGLGGALGLVGGPWGAAFIGGTAILTHFWQQQQEAKARVEALTESLDKQTGAVTDLTKAEVFKQLRDSGAIEAARDLGINLKDLEDAALGSEAAMGRVRDVVDQFASGRGFAGRAGDPLGLSRLVNSDQEDAANKIRDALHDTGDAFRDARRNAADFKEAVGETTTDTKGGARAFEVYTTRISEAKNELKKLIDAEKKRHDAQIARRRDEIGLREAIRQAREEAKEGKKVLDDGTKAADDNMSALLDLAEQWNNSKESVQNAKGAYRDIRRTFIELADQMNGPNGTRADAKALADELLNVPKKVPIKFQSEGYREVFNQVKTLQAQAKRTEFHFAFISEGFSSQPPNRSPQRAPSTAPAPAQTNQRGGVFIASQTVVAHDYKDFVQQSQRRSIAAAGEGMPRR